MDKDAAKRAAALAAVSLVEDGMIVGLGTGSTAYYAIQEIGRRVKEQGLTIQGVPTSMETERLARQLGIPVLLDFTEVDITIDGADEVDKAGNLIKGGGGALTREKIVAAASKKEVIIVDESKLVATLGKFPLPVEVLPFGWKFLARQLERLGCECRLREIEDKIFVTDNQNYILDCRFQQIQKPSELDVQISRIPGVVEHGLFIGLTHVVLIGLPDGRVTEWPIS